MLSGYWAAYSCRFLYDVVRMIMSNRYCDCVLGLQPLKLNLSVLYSLYVRKVRAHWHILFVVIEELSIRP